MIGWLLSTRLGRGVMWLAAGLLAVFAAHTAGRREGAKGAKAETLQKDIDRAEVLRKRAAAARTDADRERDAARFLRKRGRLRD